MLLEASIKLFLHFIKHRIPKGTMLHVINVNKGRHTHMRTHMHTYTHIHTHTCSLYPSQDFSAPLVATVNKKRLEVSFDLHQDADAFCKACGCGMQGTQVCWSWMCNVVWDAKCTGAQCSISFAQCSVLNAQSSCLSMIAKV